MHEANEKKKKKNPSKIKISKSALNSCSSTEIAVLVLTAVEMTHSPSTEQKRVCSHREELGPTE